MKKMNMKLLALIPAFTLVSVVGAGFATWYFGASTGTASKNADVQITSMVADGFSITAPEGNIYLVADQRVNQLTTERPAGDVCNGVYLSSQDYTHNSSASVDGFELSISKDAAGSATVNIQWTAVWASTNSESEDAGDYLSLTDSGTITNVIVTNGTATTLYVLANQYDRTTMPSGLDKFEGNPTTESMNQGEASYANNITNYSAATCIDLGIDYKEDMEPTVATQGEDNVGYNKLSDALNNTTLQLTFTVVAASN